MSINRQTSTKMANFVVLVLFFERTTATIIVCLNEIEYLKVCESIHTVIKAYLVKGNKGTNSEEVPQM